MKKTCAYCGKEFESRHVNTKYCSKNCSTLAYYYRYKTERYNFKKPEADGRLTKEEKEAIKTKRKNRRNAIYKLMRETGIQYGEVSAFYDKNDIDGLYKKARYLKSIGEIKEETPEARIVKSHGGKITGGFDYFMISTK
ncbi:hypothetical protein [Megamonas funiformis]|uniref:hypothetical protein n=1 Tax=Megamonas funiformis TaxID=437897 RepID=UPI00294369E6|nr:hypothetical protein [Megamonas funiformis]